MQANHIILQACKDELGRSIDIETEKCNRYREQINELTVFVQENEQTKKNEINNLNLFRDKKEQQYCEQISILQQQNHLLKTELQTLKLKTKELKDKNFHTKLKLSSVLVLDSFRFFLPDKVGN